MSQNYLDSISPQELDRLKSQHDAWQPETSSFLREMGFAEFKNIVEFGCGPGFTAIDLATTVNPGAEISALDVSDYYLDYLRQRVSSDNISNLKVIQRDITDGSPAEEVGSQDQFDAAFCRWFLAWVTRDIDTVLANIYYSLKPGGLFAAMEYLTLKSTVYSPPCATLPDYLNAWEEFYLQCGGTTEVGATLPEKITSAGFKIVEMRCVGGFSPKGERLFNWWKRLYLDFRDKFQENGLLTSEDIKQSDSYWESSEDNPNAFIYTPILLQIAAIKQ